MQTTIIEYIWVDSKNELRAKSKTLQFKKNNKLSLDQIPQWSFDGSSTQQATTENSEVILKPQALFRNPLRKLFDKYTYLVVCDCYDGYDKPLESNSRYKANEIFSHPKVQEEKIWFGLEQEYVLYDKNTMRLVGWPKEPNSWPSPQGQFYCNVGRTNSLMRKIIEKHYLTCLKADLNITGINIEVLEGQAEFQCFGSDISCVDQLLVARYFLQMIAEKFDILVSYEPKPIDNFNGTGLHHNFSTEKMRNNIEEIYLVVNKLSKKHKEHLAVYGDNSKRLTGIHETSSRDKFTFGIADRSSSIRIPLQVFKDKKGYCEDRRPAGDADIYLSTSIIAQTIILDD